MKQQRWYETGYVYVYNEPVKERDEARAELEQDRINDLFEPGTRWP